MILLLPLAASLRAQEERLPLELELLQEKREDAVRKIDMTFKTELEKLRAAFTKRGDLEAANRVDTLLKVMSEPNPLAEPFGQPFKDLTGEWRVLYSNEALRVYTIDLKGNVTDAKGRKARLRPIPDGYLLEFLEGQIERLTFRAERMFVEHWNPKSGYEEGVVPPIFGIGTRSA